MRKVLVLVCLVSVLVACAPAPAGGTKAATVSPAVKSAAPAGAVSFAGRTITVIVPVTPGGGSDINARFWAQHLPKFLPGNPTIVVRSMPGGEATIGSNYAYAAKPDGLTILASTGSVHMNALLGKTAVRYDPTKMPLIIAVADGNVTFVKPGMVSSAKDIPNIKGLKFGFSAGGTGYAFIIAKEILGFATESVTLAYGGSSDARRAFLSGEINCTGEGTISFNQVMMDYMDKKEIVPLYQSGLVGDKGDIVKDPILIAQIPTLQDVYQTIYGKMPSGVAWDAYISLIAAAFNYKKGWFLPPGTPDNVVKTFWTAAAAMVKDPGYKKADEAMGTQNALVSVGEAGDQAYKLGFKMDKKVVDWLRALLQKYGVVVD